MTWVAAIFGNAQLVVFVFTYSVIHRIDLS